MWLGAASSHLARLDRVQRRALHLIGHGVAIDSLAIRRTVAGLTLLYKLHFITGPPSLLSLLPAPSPPPLHDRTRRATSLANKHPYQLNSTLPVHASNSALRSYPHCLVSLWNILPPALLTTRPTKRGLQGFKVRLYQHLKRSSWNWASDFLGFPWTTSAVAGHLILSAIRITWISLFLTPTYL